MRRKFYLSIGILGLLLTVVPAQAQIISPEEAIGFPVGTDYKLARWEAITQYLRSLATNADRVIDHGDGLASVRSTVNSPFRVAMKILLLMMPQD